MYLITLAATMAYVIWYANRIKKAWNTGERDEFLVIMVATALIGRIHVNEMISTFIEGANTVLYGALIIGMARSIVSISWPSSWIPSQAQWGRS